MRLRMLPLLGVGSGKACGWESDCVRRGAGASASLPKDPPARGGDCRGTGGPPRTRAWGLRGGPRTELAVVETLAASDMLSGSVPAKKKCAGLFSRGPPWLRRGRGTGRGREAAAASWGCTKRSMRPSSTSREGLAVSGSGSSPAKSSTCGVLTGHSGCPVKGGRLLGREAGTPRRCVAASPDVAMVTLGGGFRLELAVDVDGSRRCTSKPPAPMARSRGVLLVLTVLRGGPLSAMSALESAAAAELDAVPPGWSSTMADRAAPLPRRWPLNDAMMAAEGRPLPSALPPAPGTLLEGGMSPRWGCCSLPPPAPCPGSPAAPRERVWRRLGMCRATAPSHSHGTVCTATGTLVDGCADGATADPAGTPIVRKAAFAAAIRRRAVSGARPCQAVAVSPSSRPPRPAPSRFLSRTPVGPKYPSMRMADRLKPPSRPLASFCPEASAARWKTLSATAAATSATAAAKADGNVKCRAASHRTASPAALPSCSEGCGQAAKTVARGGVRGTTDASPELAALPNGAGGMGGAEAVLLSTEAESDARRGRGAAGNWGLGAGPGSGAAGSPAKGMRETTTPSAGWTRMYCWFVPMMATSVSGSAVRRSPSVTVSGTPAGPSPMPGAASPAAPPSRAAAEESSAARVLGETAMPWASRAPHGTLT